MTTATAEAETFRRRLVALGLDVHDGPLQELGALRLDLYLFRSQIASTLDGDEAASRLLGRVADLSARLEATEGELRRIASLAGSSELLVGSFPDALRRLVDEHARGRPVDWQLAPGVGDARLGDEARIAVLRVVQAAIANVVQHSGARACRVRARRQGDLLELAVCDDGRGFDVVASEERASEESRLGLFGMRARLAELGGELVVASAPGRGTCVRVSIPCAFSRRPARTP